MVTSIFGPVNVGAIEDRGLGLITEIHLNNENDELAALLTIPRELILSAAGIEEYARESKDFRQLLDVAGHQSLRSDILLFLLTQLVLSSPDYKGGQGAVTAWTQYVKLLPTKVPVPTMWSEHELSLLRGTSLESAVSAKLATLAKEFSHIRDTISDLPQWTALVEADEITLRDWILLDALYRSRSLALPRSGEAMVPCLDLVNHSSPATAYFEESSEDEVLLLLRKDANVLKSNEITIDYGHDKSAAEMLFSYGFIDPVSTAKSILLPVEPMADDPLAKAKLYAFGSAPTLKITDNENGVPKWDAPFIYLMCLNDEDGLHFRVLQENDGSQDLRMFWQDTDITREAGTIETLIKGHELCQVFRLRAATVALQMIQQQVEILRKNSAPTGHERSHVVLAALKLRAIEKDLLERALEVLEQENNRLLEDKSVTSYLSAMNDTQGDNIDEEDFT
ncbi:hypothetical protein F5B22DRAFT_647606 [Xylaria bambusicola]|uniref:uncharacterized protein n=1 Tax=Xylaria bambusicola TaxID=326684 RepID=UPI0020074249|nr:uncharacterized protein F5B22DRAFT_647606 [Xylaria bambusicola]KAI0514567.1 hypothetical protein F5B22DRAFT_647606 [Xylaria bambusicola]